MDSDSENEGLFVAKGIRLRPNIQYIGGKIEANRKRKTPQLMVN